MKISKITIKSLFGIKEWSGDGKNIELVGDNGTGKTSIIDAIRYALTNASDREYIIKNGDTSRHSAAAKSGRRRHSCP